jgi:glycosyltransferase involved in cell wall biosynthesis
MRILQVIQELGSGGAEQLVRRLCAAGIDAGDTVAIAYAGSAAPPEGVTRLPLPLVNRRPAKVLEASRRLHRHIAEWKPDLVHAHNPGMAVVSSLATRRGRSRPGLVTLHGVPPEDERSAARVLRWAGLPVIACGAGVAASLREHGTAPLRTVNNGVGPPPPDGRGGTIRHELGLASGLRLVVAAGRLVPQKRHELAVEAVARIPDVALLILGDGPLKPSLIRRIEERGLSSRVRLLGVRHDARAILGAAEVVVQPSDWEGLPMVVLEAMSAGRPVVATRIRGVQELVRDGIDGLLVAPGDAHALATGIRTLLDHPDLARRLGAAAASRVEVDFSEAGMAGSYRVLWRQFAP